MPAGRPRRGSRSRDDADPDAPARRELLARRVRAARALSGLTQEEAAHRARMQTAVYSRIERGEVDPHISTMSRIATALAFPLNELVVDLDRIGRPRDPNAERN
ncbi:helix-turn-helix domain-containing protein [Conexibacter woesei]|uniref:helix-turn-helix domain-containing protein n=1 Tax=Conexibacter woesei TaxID=191495 RepID=UPI0009DBB7DC|nr:helix-turn-helix transcriptional regulator [Conexibacter woesei]